MRTVIGRTASMEKDATWEQVKTKGRMIFDEGGVLSVEDMGGGAWYCQVDSSVAGKDGKPYAPNELPTIGAVYDVIIAAGGWEGESGSPKNTGGWIRWCGCTCPWYVYRCEPGGRWHDRICSHIYAAVLAINKENRLPSQFKGDRGASMKKAYWERDDSADVRFYDSTDGLLDGYCAEIFKTVEGPYGVEYFDDDGDSIDIYVEFDSYEDAERFLLAPGTHYTASNGRHAAGTTYVDHVSVTSYVSQVPQALQDMIEDALIADGYTDADIERAMNSRLCDLEETIDIWDIIFRYEMEEARTGGYRPAMRRRAYTNTWGTESIETWEVEQELIDGKKFDVSVEWEDTDTLEQEKMDNDNWDRLDSEYYAYPYMGVLGTMTTRFDDCDVVMKIYLHIEEGHPFFEWASLSYGMPDGTTVIREDEEFGLSESYIRMVLQDFSSYDDWAGVAWVRELSESLDEDTDLIRTIAEGIAQYYNYISIMSASKKVSGWYSPGTAFTNANLADICGGAVAKAYDAGAFSVIEDRDNRTWKWDFFDSYTMRGNGINPKRVSNMITKHYNERGYAYIGEPLKLGSKKAYLEPSEWEDIGDSFYCPSNLDYENELEFNVYEDGGRWYAEVWEMDGYSTGEGEWFDTEEEAKAWCEQFSEEVSEGVRENPRYARRKQSREGDQFVCNLIDTLNGSHPQLNVFFNTNRQSWGWTLTDGGTAFQGSDAIYETREDAVNAFWAWDADGMYREASRKKAQYGGASVRDWYMAAFPTDSMGAEIDPSVTFDDVIRFVEGGGGDGFYGFIGAYDSLVRQRIFYEISDETGIDYDYWYTLWLYGDGLRKALSNYTSDYDIKYALGSEWGSLWIKRNIKNASRRMAQVGTNLEWEHEVDDNGDWWFADVDDFELSIWFPESFNGSEWDAYQWNIYRKGDGYVSLGGGEPSLEQAMDAAYREIAEYDDTIMEMDGSRKKATFWTDGAWYEYGENCWRCAFGESYVGEVKYHPYSDLTERAYYTYRLLLAGYLEKAPNGNAYDTLEEAQMACEKAYSALPSWDRMSSKTATRTATRNFTYAEQQSLQDESLGEMARNRHKLKNVDDDEADASAMFM